MSKTIIEHERALERMLVDVQEEKNRWLTLATATLDISKSNRRLEEKVDKGFADIDKRFEQVDKRFEQVDKRFDTIDRKFDQVDKRFGIIEDDLRFVKSHIELVVGLALGNEKPKQAPTEQ